MTEHSLIYRCGGRLQALPLGHVVEIMRPLPIDAPLQAAPLLRGICTIRGGRVPVFDLASLSGSDDAVPTRLITIRSGERYFAILADEVLGVQAALGNARPFLDDLREDCRAVMESLDADLRAILGAVRTFSEQAKS